MYITRKTRQGGTSLLEVLVSVVVLSFGLLGMAGLQMTALKANQTSMQRSQAVVLAHDIIDLMLANRQKAKDGDYLKELNGAVSAPGGSIAAGDLQGWVDRVEKVFGTSAKTEVCRTTVDAVDCGSGDYVRVRIQWLDRENAEGDPHEVAVAGRVW